MWSSVGRKSWVPYSCEKFCGRYQRVQQFRLLEVVVGDTFQKCQPCQLAIVFSVHRITASDSSFVVLKLFLFNANLHTQRYIIYLISFALFLIYTFEIMDDYC
jgi:hypothetical protein